VAYVSLYRKYRSQTFAEVVGQDHVTTTLARAVDEGRPHHAYLFTGPRGTGKTSTARILAKSLNCERGPTSDPDGTCPQCVGITEGSSIDVIEIDAASHGGVDDVRELRERVAFAPAAARTKVYIVDECHMLSTAGWNAFLKTVEEPPGHVVFVFATTEPHKVLPTILSRTQRFDFRRIPADLLAAHCRHIGDLEGFTFEPGALDLVVRAGDGSARDTLSVLDQVVAFVGPAVTLAGVAEVLGAVPDELLIEATDAIADGDVAALCLLVQRLADGGVDLRQFARDAVEHLRSLFLLQTAPDAGLVETTPERLARLTAQSSRLGRIELLRAVELLAEAQAEMRRGNTRLPLELALVKAALPEASGDPAALAARMDRLERRTGVDPVAVPSPPPDPGPVAAPPRAEPPPTAPARPTAPESGPVDEPVAPAPAPAEHPAPAEDPAEGPAPAEDPAEDPAPAAVSHPAPAAEGPTRAEDPAPAEEPTLAPDGARPVDVEMVRTSWPAVLAALKQRRKRALTAHLEQGHPIAVAAGAVEVSFDNGLHAEEVAREAALLGEVFQELFGVALGVRTVIDDATAGVGGVSHVDREAARESQQRSDVMEREQAHAAGTVDHAAEEAAAVELLQRDLGATLLDEP